MFYVSSCLQVSVNLGADSKGHPTVSAASCNVDIGHLSIDFHGGARLGLSMQGVPVHIRSFTELSMQCVPVHIRSFTELSMQCVPVHIRSFTELSMQCVPVHIRSFTELSMQCVPVHVQSLLNKVCSVY